MANAVYSRRFIVQRGLESYSDHVICPEGHVYVVKQLTFFTDPLGGTVRGWFEDFNTSTALFSCGIGTTIDPITSTPGWFGFYGHLVFPPGEGFVWRVDGGLYGLADVYAGGYDLISP